MQLNASSVRTCTDTMHKFTSGGRKEPMRDGERGILDLASFEEVFVYLEPR